MCPPMIAYWCQLVNTNEFVLPWTNPRPQPTCKSIGSAVSAQLTAEIYYILQWAPLSPKLAGAIGLCMLAMVPKTPEPISTVSGPKFTILWGHLEDILLLNKFFSIVDMYLSCKDIA